MYWPVAGQTRQAGDIVTSRDNLLPRTLDLWYASESPWNSGFISLMRAIAARSPDAPPPGKASRPSEDPFRLRQSASLVFPPREIAGLGGSPLRPEISLFGLGIWGPHSVLPLHMTEQAHLQAGRQDLLLHDFADIFHHRALSLFYRAWFLCQDSATLDNPSDELFSQRLSCLAGLTLQKSPAPRLPAHAQLAAIPHLLREARNPEGLTDTLQHYFAFPVRIEEFVSQWISLEMPDRTSLGMRHTACLLGKGAISGDKVLDRQHKFRLIIGPLTLAQYLLFTPWGDDLPLLREWVRYFTGVEYCWDVQLILIASEIPAATLNGDHRLGHAVWLERYPSSLPLAGMCFEPENIRTSISQE